MDNALLIKNYLIKEFGIPADDSATMTIEYIENLERLYSTACKGLNDNSWHDLDRLGHSVKGTSGNVGAVVITELGKQLQEACELEDINQFNGTLGELRKALELLKETQEEL